MKLDQGYTSKCKFKLKKACIVDGEFEVTHRKVQIWFNILNHIFFRDYLPNFDIVKIKFREESLGSCEFRKGKYILEIRPWFNSKKDFLEILVHEMIHLYEHLENEKMTHGPNFFLWKETVNRFNLRLHIAYPFE